MLDKDLRVVALAFGADLHYPSQLDSFLSRKECHEDPVDHKKYRCESSQERIKAVAVSFFTSRSGSSWR